MHFGRDSSQIKNVDHRGDKSRFSDKPFIRDLQLSPIRQALDPECPSIKQTKAGEKEKNKVREQLMANEMKTGILCKEEELMRRWSSVEWKRRS